jgi:hypothetical protein
MKKTGRRLFLLFLAVLIAVSGVVVHRVYPYLQTPDTDAGVLQAQLNVWQARHDAIAYRPSGPRQAFNAFLAEIEPISELAPNYRFRSCPTLDESFLPSLAQAFADAATFDEHLNWIVNENFIWQDDGTARVDQPWNRQYRRWIHLQAWRLVADPNEYAMLAEPIERVGSALIQAPSRFNLVSAVGAERTFDAAVVYLLPRLSEEALTLHRAFIAQRPDLMKAVLAAIEVEAANVLVGMDNPKALRRAWGVSNVSSFFAELLTYGGWLRGENLRAIDLVARQLAATRSWIDRGFEGKTPNLFFEARKTSVVAPAVLSGVWRMSGVAALASVRRARVAKAIEMELARRAAGEPGFETAYDGEKKIVVTGDHGCIVPREPVAP